MRQICKIFIGLIAMGSAHISPDASFRALQSGESSETSEEVVNQCCKRVEKFVTLGHGPEEGTELRLDVGECVRACEVRPFRPLRREEFDRYLKKYPNMDPVQIFLALQSRVTPSNSSSEELEEGPSTSFSSSSSPCLSSTCVPSALRSELHFAVDGTPTHVQVIEACDCAVVPESCQRVSSLLRVYSGTPFETVVDVGGCAGSCSDDDEGSACRPVRNRTVSVEGPNGAQCIPIIKECSCTGSCYRIKKFHKVYDYSPLFDNSSSPRNNSNNELEVATFTPPTGPLIKMIDIGGCVGSCGLSFAPVTSKCLRWSEDKSICLSSLNGGRAVCAPSKFSSHSYRDLKGASHSLYSVTSCGCR